MTWRNWGSWYDSVLVRSAANMVRRLYLTIDPTHPTSQIVRILRYLDQQHLIGQLVAYVTQALPANAVTWLEAVLATLAI